MSELRKDPVINRWVITLDDKSFKPQADSKIPANLSDKDSSCALCPGNEDKTGKNILSVNDPDGKWKVRVIPNNHPYLRVETPLKKKGVGIFDVISGTGANEIIVDTPLHNVDFDKMDVSRVVDVIRTYKDRILDLKNDTRLEYVLIFKNRGERAGSNSQHLHSQLMALPVIPKKITEEMDASKEYFNFKKRCVYCDLVDNEIHMKERIVRETERFVCITPFASQTPFEMWIIPKTHASHFYKLSENEEADLAIILKDSITRLNKALNYPSYNYMIHTTPVKQQDIDHYHWHIEIMPRVKSIAGFEWGSGFYINPTLPEEAADFLRKV
ncbi:MAG: galactose-1-phosphate uridylyltransferase [bacterium]